MNPSLKDEINDLEELVTSGFLLVDEYLQNYFESGRQNEI